MLDKVKTGCALGGFIAFMHIVWAALVASNYAQPLTDFIFRLHMLQNPLMITNFDFLLAVSLVGLTAVVGFVVGYIFAFFYNWAHMSPKKRK